MKRLYGIMITVCYAWFAALLAYCSLEIAVIGTNALGNEGDYPRFVPFCFGTAVLAFAAVVVLLILDKKLAAGAKQRRRLIISRLIGTALLFLPSWFTVALLFGWLRSTF